MIERLCSQIQKHCRKVPNVRMTNSGIKLKMIIKMIVKASSTWEERIVVFTYSCMSECYGKSESVIWKREKHDHVWLPTMWWVDDADWSFAMQILVVERWVVSYWSGQRLTHDVAHHAEGGTSKSLITSKLMYMLAEQKTLTCSTNLKCFRDVFASLQVAPS